jgi:hypothetical protein
MQNPFVEEDVGKERRNIASTNEETECPQKL